MIQTKEARQHRPILRRRKELHLPDDIMFQIVERLPVKSLLRFRCVCKSWKSYINDPKFISTRYINNHDDDDGYVIHMEKNVNFNSPGKSEVCTVACDRTFESISELRIPFSFESGVAFFVGSCNGLLCLWNLDADLCLWNPSIRKFKRLPSCTDLKPHRRVTLGFAYDSQINDYKVVRIWFDYHKPVIKVYTLSLDSWEIVELGIPWSPNVVYYQINSDMPSPVSGNLHWMLIRIERRGEGQGMRKTRMILSFDVNSEKFNELPLPDVERGSFKEQKCLTSFKGKLALSILGEQPHGTSISIWVMREYGVHESWNKLCVVSAENTVFVVSDKILTRSIGFTKDGPLLIQKNYKKTKRSRLKNKYVLIDPETLHEKAISIKGENVLAMYSYMENLALLDGANVESY
ncbi:hypothetical protein ACB092_11G117900 [Castanea dentata]